MLNDFLPTYNLKTFQRCQVAARTIANALRDICKKILIERSLAQVIGLLCWYDIPTISSITHHLSIRWYSRDIFSHQASWLRNLSPLKEEIEMLQGGTFPTCLANPEISIADFLLYWGFIWTYNDVKNSSIGNTKKVKSSIFPLAIATIVRKNRIFPQADKSCGGKSKASR